MAKPPVPARRIMPAPRIEIEQQHPTLLPDIDYLTPVVQVKPRIHRFSHWDYRGRAIACCGELMLTLFGEWNERTRHVFRSNSEFLMICKICMNPKRDHG